MPKRKRYFLLDRVKYPGSYPGRTAHCQHSDCFDIYDIECSEGHVCCPICGERATTAELVADSAVGKVLRDIRWNKETETWLRKHLKEIVPERGDQWGEDPLTLEPITIPVKGPDCDHRRCFDLKTYYLGYAQHAGTCPVCKRRAPLSQLVIDKTTERYLKESRQPTEGAEVIDVESYHVSALTVKIETDGEMELHEDEREHNALEVERQSLRRERQDLEVEQQALASRLAQVAEKEALLEAKLVSSGNHPHKSIASLS